METRGLYRYLLPSSTWARAPLLTSRRSSVRTVASVHCLVSCSWSTTSVAATGEFCQTTDITSHSALVMRMDRFIEYVTNVTVLICYICNSLSTVKGQLFLAN